MEPLLVNSAGHDRPIEPILTNLPVCAAVYLEDAAMLPECPPAFA